MSSDDDSSQSNPSGPGPLSLTSSCFSNLDLPDELLGAIAALGWTQTTPIQSECLPHSLAGRDIAGRAQTGTGKTAAFLITAFAHMLKNPIKGRQRPGAPRALVLAPTRELAIQIAEDAKELSAPLEFRTLAIYGGMDREKQRRALDDPVDVVAGTPGRLIDFMNSRTLDVSETEILVIDEADRLLDMGFIPDVRRIVRRLPEPGTRQTMFFSATLDRKIMRLVGNWLKDHLTIEIEPEHVLTDLIEEHFYSVPENDKFPLLLGVLEQHDVKRMLIFGNRRDTTSVLHRRLEAQGILCSLLSGDIAQGKRLSILERFRSGEVPIMIATDVAARGIHVDGISHVINFDLPYDADSYVHRVGRTGRAGVRGIALSFVDESGGFMIQDIEEFVGREIRTEQPPDTLFKDPDLDKDREARRPRPRRDPPGGGRSGGGNFRGRPGGRPGGRSTGGRSSGRSGGGRPSPRRGSQRGR